MKTPDQARDAVRKWLGTHLPAVVAAAEPDQWTTGRSVSLLGEARRSTLQANWPTYQAWARDWFTKRLPEGVTLREVLRQVGPSEQPIPSHLEFSDIDAMCAYAGRSAELMQMRSRWASIESRFPGAPDPAGALRRTRTWSDVDFATLMNTARWFADNPEGWHNLTPRQVPVPGLQSKWLNAASRVKEISGLTGIGPIEMLGRPPTIRFTYCDPAHLAAKGRQHDTWVRGDLTSLAYAPRTVVIVENQDTYFYFPERPGLIVCWGVGDMAPTRLAECDWIASAEDVVYWGDIDADGYRILDALRTRIPQTRSILMNIDTYEEYERFGTNLDRNGRPIKAGLKWDPVSLTNAEIDVLRLITRKEHAMHRRVEQERIPLPVALPNL